jgi:broad-specificity NMP kinase
MASNSIEHELLLFGFRENSCQYFSKCILNDLIITNLVSVPKPNIIFIAEPNMIRFILEDFTKNAKQIVNMLYNQIDDLTLNEQEIHLDSDRLTSHKIGPGVHQHKENEIYLVYEMADSENFRNATSVNCAYRLCLIGFNGVTKMNDYMLSLKINQKEDNSVSLYVHDAHFNWIERKLCKRKKETLFIGDLWSDIYQDAKDFFSKDTKKWYNDRGILWKRSYVFSSNPGCGKSSTIKILAAELNLNLYYLNIAAHNLTDTALTEMMVDVETNSIIAIEDIDRIFDNFSNNRSESSVSFSTLLNIMDGVISKEGVLFILTCNDFSKLDDALKRSGRISREFFFHEVNACQAKDVFLQFYPDAVEHAEIFAKKMRSLENIPMSSVEEFFLQNRKNSSEEALKNFKFSNFKSQKRPFSMVS